MTGIDEFEYSVVPNYYAMNFDVTKGEKVGYAKVLKIKVKVNGDLHTSSYELPNIRPYETELDYYTERALYDLKKLLKETEEAKEK
jgi:hypothetical protein